jgi:hypothetical protein
MALEKSTLSRNTARLVERGWVGSTTTQTIGACSSR